MNEGLKDTIEKGNKGTTSVSAVHQLYFPHHAVKKPLDFMKRK